MEKKQLLSRFYFALFLSLAFLTLAGLPLISATERQTNGAAAVNENSAFLPFVAAAPNAAGNLFSEMTADADLDESQLALLDEIKNAPTTERLNLVKSHPDLLKDAEALNLNLFADASAVFLTTSLEETGVGQFTWYGTDMSGQNQALLVVSHKELIGTIHWGSDLYRIHTLGGGIHVITQVDQSGFIADHPPEYEAIEREFNNSERDPNHLQSLPRIRVLVAYTPMAARAVWDINMLIDLAIRETNLSFANSKIDRTIELVHSYETSFAETGIMNTDLTLFRGTRDGFMDEVHTLRTRHSADVVILLSASGDFCGLASGILTNYANSFAVVRLDCATGYYSFGHELGHLLGARHNLEADPSSSPFACGHGYYNPGQTWRTVMSYNCPNGCSRLPFWSNPTVLRNEERMGTEARNYNASVIDEGVCATTAPPPPSPTSTRPLPTPTQPPPTATQPPPTATSSVPLPDLVVTSLQIDSMSLERITYSYTVKNIGTAPANLDGPTPENHDNVSVQAKLSIDAQYDDSDSPAGGTILGLSPLGYLYSGETFSGSFSASPFVDPFTMNYLILKVDSGNVVEESSETNNALAVAIPPPTATPAVPAPILEYEGFEGGTHNLSVVNWASFPKEMFESAPDLPPCGLNTNSSRTWVNIYDVKGGYIYGFCAFNSPEDLTTIWFSVSASETPPEAVNVILSDRRTGIDYRSNSVEIR